MFHALLEICITLGSVLRRTHSFGFPSPCGVLGWFRDAGISRRSFVTSGSRDIMYIVVRLRSLVAESATEHLVGDVHHRCSLIFDLIFNRSHHVNLFLTWWYSQLVSDSCVEAIIVGDSENTQIKLERAISGTW